jgi:molybdopterin converting factor small subunit
LQVKVRFAGLTRHYIGEKEKVYELPEGASVGDLLASIGRDYGSRLPRQMWDEKKERLHHSIRAARRGSPLAEDDEVLEHGEEIYIISRMAGG